MSNFVTNGCSVPFNLASRAYEECCVRHDLAYWMGGSLDEKKNADVALINCIRSKGAANVTGAMWESALSRFGISQWGDGWNPRRDNTPLTPEELGEVNVKIGDYRTEIPIVRSFQNHDVCSGHARDRVQIVTSIRRTNEIVCYNLINTSGNSKSYSQIIFSEECSQGYFAHQYEIKHPNQVVNEQLAAYGTCAGKIRAESWTQQKIPNTFHTAPPVRGSR